MTQPIVGGVAGGGVPPRVVPGGAVASSLPPPTDPVPAGATSQVFHPWDETQAMVQSQLKTRIQVVLAEFNRSAGEAGRLLDTAQAIATQQAGALETAAWVAWQRYMDEATTIRNAIMTPALEAYGKAMGAAHDRLRTELGPVEKAYTKAVSDANWTKSLANPGSATV